jgi:outer membrane protein TolC
MTAGFPAHLLQYRPDIRQAERELAAPGLDVKVARAHFYPRIDITGGVGYEAFSPTDMFLTRESLIGSIWFDVFPHFAESVTSADGPPVTRTNP